MDLFRKLCVQGAGTSEGTEQKVWNTTRKEQEASNRDYNWDETTEGRP